MEVILREDVPGLGIIGDVVKVKPGYARNYLLPRGIAVQADPRNLKQLEHHKRIIDAKKSRERSGHEKIAASMGGVVVETEVRAGKGGKLFGSVTNMDVQRLLEEKDFKVDRRRIELRDPIKEVGEFEVVVRVGQDIASTVKVVVKPLGGELEDKSVDGEDELSTPPPPIAADTATDSDAPAEASDDAASSDGDSDKGATGGGPA